MYINTINRPVSARWAVPRKLPTHQHNETDSAHIISKFTTMIQEDAAKEFLNKSWQRMPFQDSSGKKPSISDIPYIFELANQEVMPTKIRDAMYQILREMVPQFGEVKE